MNDDKIKVLIVEDEAIIALDIEEQLSQFGYQICGVAASSNKALSLTEQQNPDIILMDIQIQGSKDGIEVAKEVQKTHEIPIVFLTAHTDKQTRNRIKECAPYGYIVKPFDSIELHTALQIAINKHSVLKSLKEAHSSLNVLSYAICHELKSPIRHVLHNAQLLQAQLSSELSPNNRELLQSIINESKRSQELIHKSYAFSKSMQQKAIKKTIHLNDLIKNIISANYSNIKEKDVFFKINSLPSIKSDKSLISSVFINLIDNAIKNKRSSNKLIIEFGELASKEKHSTVLYVRDNGEGISSSKIEGIFELVNQGNSSGKLGCGIGLSLVKQMILRLSGQIHAESKKGQGSTFFITLPNC